MIDFPLIYLHGHHCTSIELSTYHILDVQKQSDLLLNADDLDAMWVCLRENCVIDDATGAEKVI